MTITVITADDILKQFQRMKNTPSGSAHARQHDILKSMVRENQDALFNLVFSNKIANARDLYTLIFFGGDGGSVAKDDNERWIPFFKRVWDNRENLPTFFKPEALEWTAMLWGIIE